MGAAISAEGMGMGAGIGAGDLGALASGVEKASRGEEMWTGYPLGGWGCRLCRIEPIRGVMDEDL